MKTEAMIREELRLRKKTKPTLFMHMEDYFWVEALKWVLE